MLVGFIGLTKNWDSSFLVHMRNVFNFTKKYGASGTQSDNDKQFVICELSIGNFIACNLQF